MWFKTMGLGFFPLAETLFAKTVPSRERKKLLLQKLE